VESGLALRGDKYPRCRVGKAANKELGRRRLRSVGSSASRPDNPSTRRIAGSVRRHRPSAWWGGEWTGGVRRALLERDRVLFGRFVRRFRCVMPLRIVGWALSRRDPSPGRCGIPLSLPSVFRTRAESLKQQYDGG
jgi:hypothetical protein